MHLLILTEARGPRLVYTFDLIFGRLLGLTYRLTHRADEFVACTGPKISYGKNCKEFRELHLPASSLLYETDIRPQLLQMGQYSGLPAIFSKGDAGFLVDFDLPAAVFYLISRYEEYLPFSPDRHGRFPSAASLAGREQFLHLPLVNLWSKLLGKKLLARFPQLPIRFPEYRYLATYDVDLAWAYRHRKWWKQLGGMGRSILRGKTSALAERLAVWSGRKADPFFTFPYLRELERKYDLRPVYFFLLSSGGPFDPNIDPGVGALRQLIRSIATRHPCGIHPSYLSNRSPEILELEIHRLQSVIQAPVTISRQHFLKLHFPATYRRLQDAGIRADYSMGYPDQVGFRAGIATPFPWYDLADEKAGDLMIHPFQVMDVTLKDYLKLSPEAAIQKTAGLIAVTREAGGCFTTLWHNSSFADQFGWRNWGMVYENILECMVAKAV